MSPQLTRRQLAAVLSSSVVLLAQAPPAPLPSNPEEEITAVKDAFRQNAEQLAKFDLPMFVEPAVRFAA